MFVEPGLVDANVLAYASNADDPKYPASRSLLDQARDPSVTHYVTPQILCEFYSVITNPRRVASPSSPAVALQALSALLALPGLSVLPTTARAVTAMLDLMRRQPVTGPEIFDLQIIATMKASNIDTIYTFNTGDFEVFPARATSKNPRAVAPPAIHRARPIRRNWDRAALTRLHSSNRICS